MVRRHSHASLPRRKPFAVTAFVTVVALIASLFALGALAPPASASVATAGIGIFPYARLQYSEGHLTDRVPEYHEWSLIQESIRVDDPSFQYGYASVPAAASVIVMDGIVASTVRLSVDGYSPAESLQGGTGTISSFVLRAEVISPTGPVYGSAGATTNFGIGDQVYVSGTGTYARQGNLTEIDVIASTDVCSESLTSCSQSVDEDVRVRGLFAISEGGYLEQPDRSCVIETWQDSGYDNCLATGVVSFNCLEIGCDSVLPPSPNASDITDPWIDEVKDVACMDDTPPFWCDATPEEIEEMVNDDLETLGVWLDCFPETVMCGQPPLEYLRIKVCTETGRYCDEPLPIGGLPIPDPSTIPSPGQCGNVDLGATTRYVCVPPVPPPPTVIAPDPNSVPPPGSCGWVNLGTAGLHYVCMPEGDLPPIPEEVYTQPEDVLFEEEHEQPPDDSEEVSGSSDEPVMYGDGDGDVSSDAFDIIGNPGNPAIPSPRPCGTNHPYGNRYFSSVIRRTGGGIDQRGFAYIQYHLHFQSKWKSQTQRTFMGPYYTNHISGRLTEERYQSNNDINKRYYYHITRRVKPGGTVGFNGHIFFYPSGVPNSRGGTTNGASHMKFECRAS